VLMQAHLNTINQVFLTVVIPKTQPIIMQLYLLAMELMHPSDHFGLSETHGDLIGVKTVI